MLTLIIKDTLVIVKDCLHTDVAVKEDLRVILSIDVKMVTKKVETSFHCNASN